MQEESAAETCDLTDGHQSPVICLNPVGNFKLSLKSITIITLS